MTANTTTQPHPFFDSGHRRGIIDHMNDDHADAVLAYSRHFGQLPEASSARLTAIDRSGLDLEVELPEGRRPLRIDFAQPLESPTQAREVLVEMARAAAEALDASSTLDRATEQREQARAAVDHLVTRHRTAILGTVSSDGLPDASVTPLDIGENRELHIYVSELSPHTANLRSTGRASLLLIEDESAADHALARRRLTFACTAEPIARGSDLFSAVLLSFRERQGPIMKQLAAMQDFHLFRLHPQAGRLVAGFGRAFDVNPADWSRLSPVGGRGHQRR
ncbi:MAG: DUF2470 domain-containing protein [Puniceicoccaceae bacterium]|nr:MAG: DUF2470 domain-containing protein [Puniceicoccaceae bacterium]